MMIILDSCVWIALINKEDSLNKRAEKLFSNLDLNAILLPDLICYEVLTVLKLRSGTEFELPKGFMRLLKTMGLKASKTPEAIIKNSI